jgi:probable HAF family extracellular repeat protein
MTDLGDLGGGYSTARGINDRGQVVGGSRTAGGEWNAFLWETGVMTNLGNLGGYCRAYGINGSGQVVGYSGTADGEYRAFLWQKRRLL